MIKISNSKEKSKNYFNKRASTYNSEHHRTLHKEIIQEALSKNPQKILDIGCGTGALLEQINKENKNIKLAGLDIAPNMIKIAKNTLQDKAELKIGDSEQIPWENNTFDIITCTSSFHHYPHPEKTLKEIKRTLEKNGTLIIGDPTIPQPLLLLANKLIKYSKNGDHKIYNQKEITKLLEKTGYKITKFHKINPTQYYLTATPI